MGSRRSSATAGAGIDELIAESVLCGPGRRGPPAAVRGIGESDELEAQPVDELAEISADTE